tara:strand:+ start:284 stop:445 length:162 start_codon:yes stop_codon:yes gene_type:complete
MQKRQSADFGAQLAVDPTGLVAVTPLKKSQEHGPIAVVVILLSANRTVDKICG